LKIGHAKIMQVYKPHKRAVKLRQTKGVMTYENEKNKLVTEKSVKQSAD